MEERSLDDPVYHGNVSASHTISKQVETDDRPRSSQEDPVPQDGEGEPSLLGHGYPLEDNIPLGAQEQQSSLGIQDRTSSQQGDDVRRASSSHQQARHWAAKASNALAVIKKKVCALVLCDQEVRRESGLYVLGKSRLRQVKGQYGRLIRWWKRQRDGTAPSPRRVLVGKRKTRQWKASLARQRLRLDAAENRRIWRIQSALPAELRHADLERDDFVTEGHMARAGLVGVGNYRDRRVDGDSGAVWFPIGKRKRPAGRRWLMRSDGSHVYQPDEQQRQAR